MKENELRNQIV